MKPLISVIVPVWKEQEIINKTIEHLRALSRDIPVEILVADGDPDRQTVKAVRYHNIKKIESPRGRGIQMNFGAKYATGDILLFLHADTLLPENAFKKILKALKNREFAGGAFDLSIDAPGTCFRVIETAASWRSRLTRIPYGDQAIFLHKRIFDKINGYKKIPLMEDVDLMRRLKKENYKIIFIPERVKTSARKWQKNGILYCTLRNWYIISLFFAGVSPDKLAKYY